MYKPQKFTAYKLMWGYVSYRLSRIISALLGRTVTCDVQQEDDNYWSAAASEGAFTIVEIASLIDAVGGAKELFVHSLPTDSNTSKSLSMELCQELLKKELELNWEAEFINSDALWIIGDFEEENAPNEPAIDWIIHLVANGVECAECGKVENSFIQHACNAHTHGMAKYNHLDFQMVLQTDPQDIGYILNTLGKRVQKGERFKPGDLVSGIFLDCDIRLDSFQEEGRTVLRVIIPDGKNRFPEDEKCDYPYSIQTLPLEQLELNDDPCS